MKGRVKASVSEGPLIRLILHQEDKAPMEFFFTQPFRIGRNVDCDVSVQDSKVSRVHAEFVYKEEAWWIHDLESTNGVYVNGVKVQHAPTKNKDRIELGKNGLRLEVFYVPGPHAASEPGLVDRPPRKKPVNARKKWPIFVGVAVVLAIAGGLYGQYQSKQRVALRQEAVTLFSDIRTQDVQIAEVRRLDLQADSLRPAGTEVVFLEETRRQMTDEYKRHAIDLGVYSTLTETERLIYNVARFFNESEFNIPDSFVTEVEAIIQNYWLKDHRLVLGESLRGANRNGYAGLIVRQLEDYGLPPEFFYLAVYVSGLDEQEVAGGTSSGVSKGLWALSPAVATHYGLTTGDGVGDARFDPFDERHDLTQSTEAATLFLHDLFCDPARGSGLLTLAGFLSEGRVPGMDANMGDSFWNKGIFSQTSSSGTVPDYWSFIQSYPGQFSYEVQQDVLKVFAASVIGQDPRFFGYDFDNPLSDHIRARYR